MQREKISTFAIIEEGWIEGPTKPQRIKYCWPMEIDTVGNWEVNLCSQTGCMNRASSKEKGDLMDVSENNCNHNHKQKQTKTSNQTKT